jgi:hypothetical protein
MRTTLILAITGMVLAGCSDDRSSRRTTQTASERSAGNDLAERVDDNACAIEVPGTVVEVETIDDGASVVYRTTGNVDEVRERVQNEAVVRDSTESRLTDVPASIDVEDVDDGARMDITAEDDDRVEELRQDVARNVGEMRSSRSCTSS